MIDIILSTTIAFHNKLIEDYGGSKGIRDLGSLKAAVNRPYATFDGTDLYPTSIEKSAAIFESLLINHPFIDGNKRIGYFMMEFLLDIDFKLIDASQPEKYDFTIKVAEGKMNIDLIVEWLDNHVIALNP